MVFCQIRIIIVITLLVFIPGKETRVETVQYILNAKGTLTWPLLLHNLSLQYRHDTDVVRVPASSTIHSIIFRFLVFQGKDLVDVLLDVKDSEGLEMPLTMDNIKAIILVCA